MNDAQGQTWRINFWWIVNVSLSTCLDERNSRHDVNIVFNLSFYATIECRPHNYDLLPLYVVNDWNIYGSVSFFFSTGVRKTSLFGLARTTWGVNFTTWVTTTHPSRSYVVTFYSVVTWRRWVIVGSESRARLGVRLMSWRRARERKSAEQHQLCLEVVSFFSFKM